MVLLEFQYRIEIRLDNVDYLGEWMVPVNRESTPVSIEPDKEKKEETPMEVDDPLEPKGDPEVAPQYIEQLLPVFTQVFQSSMIQSIR